MTRSLHVALEDLKLEHAWIVYPGREPYQVHGDVTVVPVTQVADTLGGLAAKSAARGRVKARRASRARSAIMAPRGTG